MIIRVQKGGILQAPIVTEAADSVVVCTDEEGREITRVELPVANVTSCAFGGHDLSTLFVTTSSRDATQAHPDAGAVFSVPTVARGQEPRYWRV